jgi:type II secretory ATPase GspE/PulE/Tfp pilus assembly ATPase PilB-like protein
MAIGELLHVSETLSERVLERSRTAVLHEMAICDGMTPLVEEGARAVRSGVTTLEELARVLPRNGQ